MILRSTCKKISGNETQEEEEEDEEETLAAPGRIIDIRVVLVF